MVFDIFIAVVILIAAIVGFRQGFAKTLSHFGGWIASFALGFFLHDNLKDFLITYTDIDEFFYKNIFGTLNAKATATVGDVPSMFKQQALDAASSAAGESATAATSVVMSIFSFLIIIILVKFLTWLIMHLFSKKHRQGVIGGVDGILGFIFGTLKGAIIVALIFAFVVPVLIAMFPTWVDFFETNYHDSFILSLFVDDSTLNKIIQDAIAN